MRATLLISTHEPKWVAGTTPAVDARGLTLVLVVDLRGSSSPVTVWLVGMVASDDGDLAGNQEMTVNLIGPGGVPAGPPRPRSNAFRAGGTGAELFAFRDEMQIGPTAPPGHYKLELRIGGKTVSWANLQLIR